MPQILLKKLFWKIKLIKIMKISTCVYTNSQKSAQSEDSLVYEIQNPDKVNSGVFFNTNLLYTKIW